MSHFAILVIGENIEEQLAPFDENLELDRYVEYTKAEAIEKERQEIQDYKNGRYAEYLADPVAYAADCKDNDSHIKYLRDEFPLKLEWSDERLYEEAIRWYDDETDAIGPDGEIYSTSNPKAKWDWFQIGGRYRDRFIMKQPELTVKGEGMERYTSLYKESEEGKGDSAKKGDIDWSKVHGTKEGYTSAIRFWEMKVEGSEPTNVAEEEELKWDWYKGEYYTDKYGDKETYAKAMSNFTMWGILKDGEWMEKGEMGWFGMSDEDNDDGLQWELNMYDKFIKDLPEDTLLTVVDCHI